MNKHQPKFMKVVPPGQYRGTIAPPYAWDARERDDWAYKSPNPKGMKEGEFDSPQNSPASRVKPVDPRKAQVDAIHAEIEKLHNEVRQLMLHKRELRQKSDELSHKAHELTQAGKSELAQRPKYKPDPEREVFVGKRKGSGRYITVPPSFPHQEAAEPFGLRPGEERERDPLLDRRRPTEKWASRSQERKTIRRNQADAELLRRHRESGEAQRDYARPPQSSSKLIQVHQQKAQLDQQIEKIRGEVERRRARVKELTDQLRRLRQQAHESIRLGPNNRRHILLLLK